jgi:hypothetical protein
MRARLGLQPWLLALLPSWFLHRTYQFSGAEERICIAFDVIPQL